MVLCCGEDYCQTLQGSDKRERWEGSPQVTSMSALLQDQRCPLSDTETLGASCWTETTNKKNQYVDHLWSEETTRGLVFVEKNIEFLEELSSRGLVSSGLTSV